MAVDHRDLASAEDGSAKDYLGKLYDPSWRGFFLQAAAILAAGCLVLWIFVAAFSDAAGQGAGGASFLFETSNIKIERSLGGYLVSYIPGQSKVYHAFFVGLINSIFLALAAIVSATIVGLCVGTLRLLANFILRGVAALYIDIFRNLPILLQMLLFYALLSAWVTTSPNGAVDMFGLATLNLSGFHAPFPELLAGGGTFLGGVALGFGCWRLLSIWSQRRKDRTGEGFLALPISAGILLVLLVAGYWSAGYDAAKNAAAWYERDFIGRETITEDPRQARIAFPSSARVTAVVSCAPRTGGEAVLVARVVGVEGRSTILLGRYHEDRAAMLALNPATAECYAPGWLSPIRWPARASPAKTPSAEPADATATASYGLTISMGLIAAWLALTLYSSAYIAEIMRAAVLAIDRGQTEAAKALGLHVRKRIKYILAPQALRLMLQPLALQYRGLIMHSAFASAVGYSDLFGLFSGGMLKSEAGSALILLMIIMVYLAMAFAVTLLARAPMRWLARAQGRG